MSRTLEDAIEYAVEAMHRLDPRESEFRYPSVEICSSCDPDDRFRYGAVLRVGSRSAPDKVREWNAVGQTPTQAVLAALGKMFAELRGSVGKVTAAIGASPSELEGEADAALRYVLKACGTGAEQAGDPSEEVH